MMRPRLSQYLMIVALMAGLLRLGMIWWAFTHYSRGVAYRVLSHW